MEKIKTSELYGSQEVVNMLSYLGVKLYKHYELNLDKVNSIDDCKRILKFLCDIAIKPTPEVVSCNGFEEVEQYFE